MEEERLRRTLAASSADRREIRARVARTVDRAVWVAHGTGSGDGGDASAGPGGIGGSGGTTGEGSTGTADGGSGAGGGIGGTGSPSTAGAVHFFLADAPSCGFDSVNVTVDRVRIHASTAAAGADKGWSEVVQTPPNRVDLLTLINGVFLDLGKTTLPAGRYKQVRLVLAENDNAHPLANSVVPTGQAETALTIPSGSQSGIKLDTDVGSWQARPPALCSISTHASPWSDGATQASSTSGR